MTYTVLCDIINSFCHKQYIKSLTYDLQFNFAGWANSSPPCSREWSFWRHQTLP